MILGGVAAIIFGVNAEGKSLEDVATPLSVIGKPAQTIFRAGDSRSPAAVGEGADGSAIPDPRAGQHDTRAGANRPDDDQSPA